MLEGDGGCYTLEQAVIIKGLEADEGLTGPRVKVPCSEHLGLCGKREMQLLL